MWSKADEERLVEEINGEIDAAVERYLKTQPQPPEAMFDYLYAELPRALAEQRAAAASGGETTMPEVTLVGAVTWRWRAPWRRTSAWSSWARTSASTAACFARRRACSSASGASA